MFWEKNVKLLLQRIEALVVAVSPLSMFFFVIVEVELGTTDEASQLLSFWRSEYMCLCFVWC